jgi:protein gp37
MNKIGWCTDTINPITGCLNGCEFCYARRFAHRLAGRFGYPADEPFRPIFHPDKLQDIAKLGGTGKRVFLDSMSDWFSPGVKTHWLAKIIDAVERKPEHTFLVLTKRPDRISEVISSGLILSTPENLWFGVSVTSQEDVWRIRALRTVWSKRFISFEPLHGPIEADLSKIHWVIIGAETGNRRGRIEPKEDWVKSIFNCVPDDTPIFMKDNLMQYMPDWSQLKDFSRGMR